VQGGQGRTQAARRGSLEGPVSLARDAGFGKPAQGFLEGTVGFGVLGLVFRGAWPSDGAHTMVCVEHGSRRTFASALEWPGGCRSGRTDHDALEVLVA
jgi:hypothetical protein